MPASILVVDDYPDMVTLIRHALTAAGHKVATAATGNEALLKAQQSPPDLVVLDLMLPELAGNNVCEILRRTSATAQVPIIMITGLPGNIPRLVGREAGADLHLNKPFQMEELVARIEELLKKGRARTGAPPAR